MTTRKPYVIDSGRLRSLHFNADEIQSAMWVARPDALYLEYTRLMMGFLLFSPKPRRIAMIGLGGGSLAKFCHRHLPASEIVAVERDAGVIALRDAFAIPPDDARLRVVEGDGGAFVAAQPDGSIDVLLVDGYSGDGLPAELGSQDFKDQSRRVDAGVRDRGQVGLGLGVGRVQPRRVGHRSAQSAHRGEQVHAVEQVHDDQASQRPCDGYQSSGS